MGHWGPPDLGERVAVVTGASRGAGRGIATVLGEAGATVYVAWGFNRTSDPLTLYLGAMMYDIAKASIIRLAFGLGREMRAHRTGLNAVAVAPGFMRTERVKRATRGKIPPGTESPEYVGRGIACLAADPRVARRSGRLLSAGALAREYGFKDVDGRQPPPFRFPGRPALIRRLLIG
jgi:NAD(P)-dependent dehydrogenase (short-subunit alcohol dehydrogenase family)